MFNGDLPLVGDRRQVEFLIVRKEKFPKNSELLCVFSLNQRHILPEIGRKLYHVSIISQNKNYFNNLWTTIFFFFHMWTSFGEFSPPAGLLEWIPSISRFSSFFLFTTLWKPVHSSTGVPQSFPQENLLRISEKSEFYLKFPAVFAII